jgi:hypothetical protein
MAMLRSLTYGFRAVSSIAAAVSPIAARCSVSGCGRSSRLTTSASLSRTKDEPRARRARSRTHTPSAPSRGTDSQRCHADRTSGRAGARRSQAGFADRTSGRAGARRSQAGFADRTSGRAGARRSQACPAANCPIGLEPATVRSVSSLGSPRSSVALCPSDEAGASAVDRGYVTPTGLQAGLEPGDPRRVLLPTVRSVSSPRRSDRARAWDRHAPAWLCVRLTKLGFQLSIADTSRRPDFRPGWSPAIPGSSPQSPAPVGAASPTRLSTGL